MFERKRLKRHDTSDANPVETWRERLVREHGQFGAFPGRQGPIVPETMGGFGAGQWRAAVRNTRMPSKPRRFLSGGFSRLFSGTEQLLALGKISFCSLWLLVFAVAWEDASCRSRFWTTARLIW